MASVDKDIYKLSLSIKVALVEFCQNSSIESYVLAADALDALSDIEEELYQIANAKR